MPTSIKDRFNESGEELYFFVKSKKYYFDLDAVRLPNQVLGVTDMRDSRFVRTTELYPNSKYRKYNYQPANKQNKVNDSRENHLGGSESWWNNLNDQKYRNEWVKPPTPRYGGKLSAAYKDSEVKGNIKGKNIPTIWQINPEPHKFEKELEIEGVEHFATFPQSLLEIPIKFGCPKDGIVLDPFMGSGTTALVSKKLGRNYIGIELNNEYVKLAESRIDAIPQSLFD